MLPTIYCLIISECSIWLCIQLVDATVAKGLIYVAAVLSGVVGDVPIYKYVISAEHFTS